MDTVTIFAICVLLLLVLCFVLDHWLLPRPPEPPVGQTSKAKPTPEDMAQASIREEGLRRFEQELLRKRRNNTPFHVYASITREEGYPRLVAHCSGKIPWHEKGTQYASLELTDITDGIDKKILCIHSQMRDSASGCFAYSAPVALPSDGFIEGPFELLRIPLESLTAPYAGRRRLRLRCALSPSDSVPEDVSKRCDAEFEADLMNPGYEDELGEGRLAVLTMELAIACGLAGRRRLGPALKVLSPWVDGVLDSAKLDEAPYFSALRSAMDHLWSEGLAEDYVVDKACLALAAAGRTSVDETLELCLLMATSDAAWPMEAVMLVRKVAVLMGISPTDVQSLLDRHLLGSAVVLEDCDWDALTGLDSSWEPSRLHKHLAARFDHWNSRAPSARTTSEQARIRTILDAIAKLRQKYA